MHRSPEINLKFGVCGPRRLHLQHAVPEENHRNKTSQQNSGETCAAQPNKKAAIVWKTLQMQGFFPTRAISAIFEQRQRLVRPPGLTQVRTWVRPVCGSEFIFWKVCRWEEQMGGAFLELQTPRSYAAKK